MTLAVDMLHNEFGKYQIYVAENVLESHFLKRV